MGIEFELKFRAGEQALEAIRAAVPGSEQHYTMETIYYDTPAGDLSSRYYTLRRRMENEASVCTFKCPAGDLGRGEFEVECSDIETAIPELCKLSNIDELRILTQNRVVAVCGAKFRRIAKTVTWEGATMELALDKGILTGGGRQLPLCEVEVELKDGSRDIARLYAMQLAATFGLIPEKHSKFRRALALAKGE